MKNSAQKNILIRPTQAIAGQKVTGTISALRAKRGNRYVDPVNECSTAPVTNGTKRKKAKNKKKPNFAKRTQTRTLHTPQTTYTGYVFVAQNEDGDWRFISLDGSTSLRASPHIRQVFPAVTSEMTDLWRRAVIDQTYDWEGNYVDPRTLGLVEVSFSARPCTELLFNDEEDMAMHMQRAVLARLDDHEARILGVDKQHALMKMFRGERNYRADSELSRRLQEQAPEEPHAEFMRALDKYLEDLQNSKK